MRGASAFAAVWNANFYIPALYVVPDFQTQHSRHDRTLPAKPADRISAIVGIRIVNTRRVPQFAFVMPPFAVRAFIRLMPRVGAPTAHVESVVSATFLDQSPLRPECAPVSCLGGGRKTVAVHRSLPPRRRGIAAAACRKAFRICSGSRYCYAGTIALSTSCDTMRPQLRSSCSWGSKAPEAISWASPVRRSNTWQPVRRCRLNPWNCRA